MTCTPEKNKDILDLESDLQEARARIGELEKECDARANIAAQYKLELRRLSLQVKEGRAKALEEVAQIVVARLYDMPDPSFVRKQLTECLNSIRRLQDSELLPKG
jgi:hypothetical protein